MLGREIPDLSQVDHSAAVEMLAPKRHQNPRQVGNEQSTGSLSLGMGQQLEFKDVVVVVYW